MSPAEEVHKMTETMTPEETDALVALAFHMASATNVPMGERGQWVEGFMIGWLERKCEEKKT
jgi:predicted NAD/FAD-dependent oxidoreductase